MTRKLFTGIVLAPVAATCLKLSATNVLAAEYTVDPAHSFVEFRIQHLGYSWLYGRFNKIEGEFSHDPGDPEASTISVSIDPASVDTNHAKRDTHIKSEDFLDVSTHPEASFTSTKYTGTAEKGELEGTLSMHGVSKPVKIAVTKLGEGDDPWGGYRAGFSGTVILDRKDFGVEYDLGPNSWTMEINLGIEGTRN